MNRDFIPSGDLDLVEFAQVFGKSISDNQQLYQVSDEDAKTLVDAVERFCVATYAARHRASRSMSTTKKKDEARAELEKIIRKIARQVRVNDKLDSAARIALQMKDRATKRKKRSVPIAPPVLRFVRSRHEGHTAIPMHELQFSPIGGSSKAKPDGAVRLELFVDLVPPNEPIPAYPGANHGGRPWYLRSFTRSPILLSPPMARVPMRVVYWARWADSSGETGPFSATAVGWIEQGTEHRIMQFGNEKHHKPVAMIEVDSSESSRPNDSTYSIEVIQARYTSYLPNQNPIDVTINQAALPAPVDEETEAA